MKKITLFFSVLLFFSLIGLTKVSAANLIDMDNEQLDRELEKIIENIPDGEYYFDDESNIQTFSTKNQYTPRAGDILFTPSTQCKNDSNICKGISGHAGIVHPNNSSVIHTAGKNKKPTVISKNTWFSNYPKTIVIRPNNATVGKNAANWAKNYYGPGGAGANKSYKVTFENNLRDSLKTKTTYCSLIIWQAYYFGANQYLSVGDPIPPGAFVSFAKYHNMTNYMKIGY